MMGTGFHAYSFILRYIRNDLTDPRRLVAVGGGAKSRTWLQIVSDVTGAPQDVPRQTIGASYGDAFLAGYATGSIPSLEVMVTHWVRDTIQIVPDPGRHKLYMQYYELYLRMYEQTREISHRLAQLSEFEREQA